MGDRIDIVSPGKPSSTLSVIARHILGDDKNINTNDREHLWRIDNKYYTADVYLDFHTSLPTFSTRATSSAQALVLVLDVTAFDEIKAWWRRCQDTQTYDVRLLVSLVEGSDEVVPADVIDWCIEHGFELVLSSEEEEGYARNGDSGSNGLQRISDALQAHMWSGLRRKDSSGGTGRYSDEDVRQAEKACSFLSAMLRVDADGHVDDADGEYIDEYDDEELLKFVETMRDIKGTPERTNLS